MKDRANSAHEASTGDSGSDDRRVERAIDATESAAPQLGETETFRDAVPTPGIPKRIGQYRIKRAIASGGMGTVYEATQEKPRRTVAVKVMRQGIASRSALRRFDYEAQLLARLRHPGIAQVYDAGTHRDGEVVVPYFAMEYIVGARPVTVYAKQKKLGTRERLKLFADVCEAVHHGHQKGIIHRDLKPSNILVDSSGQVKIIDFGVARSTDSDMAVTTLQTDMGQLIGTLQYMSPEQCAADPHDIDTRSDIYALGVILYEMLCERLPYDVKKSVIHEATRVIREEEPTRLSAHNKTLRGDVETIALKALEKDRDRRYQSASALTADINRYLNNEAISARPPSVIYQLRIFARRNKGAFASIAAVFVILVAATIVSSVLYSRAESERRDAVLARDESDTVVEFLREMIADVNPTGGKRDVTVREVLDRASKTIGDEFEDKPLLEALLRHTLSQSYVGLGEWEEAEVNASAAAALRRHELGEEHPRVLDSLLENAIAVERQGRYSEAEELLSELVAMNRRVRGAEHPETIKAMANFAYLHVGTKEYPEAETLLREVHDLSRRVLGDDHPDTIFYAYYVAEMALRQGRYDEAVSLYRPVLRDRRRILGDEHPDTLHAMNNLGWALAEAGEYAEADVIHQKTLKIRRRVLGDEHPYTLDSMHSVAHGLERQGKPAEAQAHFRQAMDTQARVWGKTHDRTVNTVNCYANWLLTTTAEAYRDSDEAMRLVRGILETSGPAPHGLAHGEENPDFLATLALALKMTGDLEGAIRTQREALALVPEDATDRRLKFESKLKEYLEAQAP